MTAYHEAGHAITVLFCKYADPLHKVTIIPRGQALGVTFMLGEEDVYTHSKLELFDRMTVMMGGRAAEELIFGDVTTGASNDIEVASHWARMMVCVFGMDNGIGPIKYGDFREHVHVRYDAPAQDILSPETAREIDLAVRELMLKAHNRAVEILEKSTTGWKSWRRRCWSGKRSPTKRWLRCLDCRIKMRRWKLPLER